MGLFLDTTDTYREIPDDNSTRKDDLKDKVQGGSGVGTNAVIFLWVH